MTCRYSEHQIALYVEGDLGAAQACEIETHLIACGACRDLAAELRESQAVFKSLKQDVVSATVLSTVRSRVLEEAGRPPVIFGWGRWVYALAGGMFVFAVAAGITHLSNRQAELPVPVLTEGAALEPPIPAFRSTEGAEEPTARSVRQPKDNEVSRTRIRERSQPASVEANLLPPVAAPDPPTEGPEIPAQPVKQIVVKLLTDDPNIVIYWLIDQNGGTL